MNGHCNDAAHNHNCEEQSRYETVLNQYSSAPGRDEIAQAVKRADETAEKNNTKEVMKEIYSCLDLTEALQKNLDKKTRRDCNRHNNNPKLK